jgi:purine-cytosine permease-like protein
MARHTHFVAETNDVSDNRTIARFSLIIVLVVAFGTGETLAALLKMDAFLKFFINFLKLIDRIFFITSMTIQTGA